MAFFSCPSVHVRRALLHVVMCVRLSVRTQPRDFDFCRFPVTDCGVLKTLRTDLMEDETLRDQLCYPHAGKDICMSDADLIILMRSVDLDFVLDRAEGAALSGCVCVCVRVALTVLVLCVARSQLPAHLHSPLATDGLDTRAKWSDMLSGGEQQRVGMVRLLYHKPTYAIMVRVCVVDVGVFVLRFFVVCAWITLFSTRCVALPCVAHGVSSLVVQDESTSALDVELEERCMQLCIDNGITCISVGHRPTLIPYHRHLLRLDGAGGFTLTDIQQALATGGDGDEAEVEASG